MKKVLIVSARSEVSKLFELLLWQPDRQFLKGDCIEKGLGLMRRQIPDLFIVDIQVAPQASCLKLCANLKSSSKHAHIPLLLICDPHKNDPEFEQLLDVVDGVLPEPFAPDVIKSKTEQYI